MTKLINPAPDAVRGNPYGPRKSINAGGYQTDDFHDGQDFKNNGQTFRVYAAAAGTVVSVGRPNGTAEGRFVYNGSGGNSVVIQHAGIPGAAATGYAHFASVAVTAGQQVAAGQFLGMAGTTGASTGIHLHFVVWPQLPWVSFKTAEPMQHIGAAKPTPAAPQTPVWEKDKYDMFLIHRSGMTPANYRVQMVHIPTLKVVRTFTSEAEATKYAQRFGSSIPLSQADYDDFVLGAAAARIAK